MGRPAKDLSGMKFGRLSVVSRDWSRPPGGSAYWLCECECGGRSSVRARSLTASQSRSCGCLAREKTSARATTHGMEGTAIYKLWSGMISRCRNKNHRAYPGYGGRGIKVCDRWLTFESFYADMGDRPPGKSLDRIDNSKGYSPENCRWSTQKEQNRNTRRNRIVDVRGDRRPVTEWAEISGVSEDAIRNRLARGEPADERVLRSVRTYSQPVEILGQTLSIVEWARLAGLKPNTVRRRFAAGDRGEKLLRPSRSPNRITNRPPA